MDSPGNVTVTSSPRENSPGQQTRKSDVHERQASPIKPTPGGGRPRPPRPAKPPIAQKPPLPVKPTLSPRSSQNDLPKGTPPPLPCTPPRGNVRMSPKTGQVPKIFTKSTKSSDSPCLQLKSSQIKNSTGPTDSPVLQSHNPQIEKKEESVNKLVTKDTDKPKTVTSNGILEANIKNKDQDKKIESDLTISSKVTACVKTAKLALHNDNGKSAIAVTDKENEENSFSLHPDHIYNEIPEKVLPELKSSQCKKIVCDKDDESSTTNNNIVGAQKSLSKSDEVCRRLKSIEKNVKHLPSKPVPKIRNSLGKSRNESDSELSSDSSCLMEMMTSRNDIPDTAKSPNKHNFSLSDSNLSSSLSLTSDDTSTFETSVSSVGTENSSIISKPGLDISDSVNAQSSNKDKLTPDREPTLSRPHQRTPSDTCDMLKEIEDLLNKKMAEVSLAEKDLNVEYFEPPVEEATQLEQAEQTKECIPRRHSMGPAYFENIDKSQIRYSLSSTPVRPPRPKRAASRKLKQFNIDLDPGSGGSTESLDSNAGEVTNTLKKKCPPKPKRTTLPRVGRTQSDVTGMKNYVEEIGSNKPPPVPRRPVFGTPDIPPPLPPRNKPQSLGGCGSNSVSNSNEDLAQSKTNGQAELVKTALGSTKQSPQMKPRPVRKAPPPPENPPALSRLKNRQAKLQQSKSTEDKITSETVKPDKSRRMSNQESKGFLVNEKDPLLGDNVVEEDHITAIHNVSKESSDHDYHEIPDSLVRDEPPSPIARDASASPIVFSTMIESSPPPQLPPRTYKEPIKGDDQSEESGGSVESSKTNPSGSDTGGKSGDGISDANRPGYLDMSGSSTPQSDKSRPVSHISQQSTGSYSDQSGSVENNQNDASSTSESETEDEEVVEAKRKKKAFLTAKEIMTSEMVFVDVLKLLNVDFRVAMSKATELMDKPVISSDVLNKILDYLPQLQNFNEDLLRDLNERIQKWDEHEKVADIFVKKGPFLKLYSSYIKNFTSATSIFDDACKKFPAFAVAVRQFESSPRCASLALKHHMLKPIQRIPQYRLLLQDYLKHLTKDSGDYQNTINALAIVSKVADHADQSTRQGDDVQKLMEIQNALIGQFEVIQPGRELIKCGELMKLSRKELQPRMFFLFNDVLLYTVSVASGYRLNQIIPVNGMKVSKPVAEDFKNEFSILSVQKSFTVAASTPEERDDWLQTLSTTIEEAAQRKNTFQTVKLQAEPQTSLLEKDFIVGHKAPLMVPDVRVTMCMLCLGEFTITWRRHHCRACGRVVCGNCSENRAPLKYLKYKSERVCSECYTKIEKEIDEGDIDTSDGTTNTPIISLNSIKERFVKIRKSARSNKAVKRPAVLKEVRANDEGSDMSGYLKSYKNKKWKKMWYVLKEKVLYTYRASEDMAAVESLPLLGYEVTRATSCFEGTAPDLVFHLIHPNTLPHIFSTDSAAATSKWINVMREASTP